MKKLVFITLSSFVLFACGGGEEKSEETEKNKDKAAEVKTPEQENKKEIVANAETTIQIDGMVCEHACVSSVKKNILAMEGVEGIEIDFVKDRKINSCKVKFDNTMVSEQDFINKINEINDGAYKAVEGEEVPAEENTDHTQNKMKDIDTDVSEFFDLKGSFEVSSSDIGTSFFSLPSLFDIFTFGF
ncbi:MAG: heavy-metal-associated domain-containing protein [Crocinitomicaceae bacterium]|nr:heavy-metal-associated domain-containing protein [Crocinitomicaceae bacterium]